MLNGSRENVDPCEPEFGTLSVNHPFSFLQFKWLSLNWVLSIHLQACSFLFKVNLPGPYIFSYLICSLGALTSCSCPSPSTGVLLSGDFPDPNHMDISTSVARHRDSLAQRLRMAQLRLLS